MLYSDQVYLKNNLIKRAYLNKFNVKLVKVIYDSENDMFVGLDKESKKYKFSYRNNEIRRILK